MAFSFEVYNMKVTDIQIQNVLTIGEVRIQPQKPITLFAGSNGSGKSSIRDCVLMAIAQQDMRGITKKKDYSALVKEGQKAGGVLVVCDNDVDQAFGFNVPKGDFTGPEISEAMRVSLDGQRFAQMDEKERRKFILSLSDKKLTPNTILPLLIERGADKAKSEAVLHMLLTGLQGGVDYAKEEATKAKGAWRQIANLTWGPKQAECWAAEVPQMPSGDLTVLKQELADHDAATATLNESLGAIKAQQDTAARNTERRAQLEASAKKVPELALLLEAGIKEHDEFQQKVEAMRERARGGKQGLVHDMARFIKEFVPTGKETAIRHANLLAAYAKEHGEITEAGAPDAAAVASLPDHERGLQVLVNKAANLQRDLDAAKMAKGQYDALEPAEDAVDASQEISEVSALIEAARAKRVLLANKVLDFEAAERGIAAAKQKTEQAAKHHQDVLAWTKIADLLSPDGIPAQLLAEALVPINANLEQAALDTGWPRVTIESDMAIRVGKRSYLMESESFKWRADAMVAQAVADVSGIKCLVLDRVDVLDVPARAELLGWLDMLVENGELSTALLFATLKQQPTSLPDSVESHWIENGSIVRQEQQEAA